MLKKQKTKKLFGYVLIASLICLFIKPDFTYADYSSLKDIIDSSEPGAIVTHTITFTNTTDIGNNGYFEVTLATDFGDIYEADCAGPDVTLSTTTDTVRCTYSTSPGATSTQIVIYDVQNPGTESSQLIDLKSYNSGDTLLESGQTAVAIVEKTYISATVDASMTFSMIGSTTPMVINGVTLTGSSTPTSLPFYFLAPGASSTLGHTLGISSNSTNGFSCTIQQDHDLINGNNEILNSFDNSPDGTGSSTPHTWNAPRGEIDKTHTWGHFGFTTDDPSLSELDFTGSKFVGFNGVNPVEIAYHDGPSQENELGRGLAHIAYTLEISELQPEGAYQNHISYVCTGNY